MTTSFLSPADLGLFPAQHSALIGTLQLLEQGLLRHVQENQIGPGLEGIAPEVDDIPNTHVFNMNCWLSQRSEDCGTIGCIGGTAALLSGDLSLFDVFPSRKGSHPEDAPQALHDLFYPSIEESYEDVTPSEAARQLRLYLETGTHEWASGPYYEPLDPIEGEYNEQ